MRATSTERDTNFTFRLPARQRAELMADAVRYGLTISDVVRLRLASPTRLPADKTAAKPALGISRIKNGEVA